MCIRQDAKLFFENKTNIKIDSFVADGAQGQVFNLQNNQNIVKLSLLFDSNTLDIEEVFFKINSVYEYIIQAKPEHLVKISEFGRLKTSERKIVHGNQKYITYYSIQEKLISLTEDEKKIFKTICQINEGELQCTRGVEVILDELSQWFSFDKKKVISFYFGLLDCRVENNDFHRRNIMKDSNGNFKLIDFDLAELKD